MLPVQLPLTRLCVPDTGRSSPLQSFHSCPRPRHSALIRLFPILATFSTIPEQHSEEAPNSKDDLLRFTQTTMPSWVPVGTHTSIPNLDTCTPHQAVKEGGVDTLEYPVIHACGYTGV